ncbi:MAG: hypothetical protein KGO96_06860 [Elusimicrobia bacterium]|nr:hypothetical protein [Elusimicrobiota bacterium]
MEELQKQYFCKKCNTNRPARDFTFPSNNNSEPIFPCKPCKRFDWGKKHWPTQCSKCNYYKQLDKNNICKPCNKENGLLQCFVCEEVKPLPLTKSRSGLCDECKKQKWRKYAQKTNKDPKTIARRRKYIKTNREYYREKNKEWHSKNKEYLKQNKYPKIRAKIVKRKVEIQKYKESIPCKDCGIKYNYWVMEFDHIRDKKYEISFMINSTHSDKTIWEEIAKCELVCTNCHKVRTYKQTELLKNNNRGFMKAKNKIREITKSFRENKKCLDCQKEYPWFVLEFDHRNPEDKIENISNTDFWIGKTPLLFEEIKKCDIVCGNCHHTRSYKRKLEIDRNETKC